MSLGDANCLGDLDTIQALFMAKLDGIRKFDGRKAMSFSGRGGHTADGRHCRGGEEALDAANELKLKRVQ